MTRGPNSFGPTHHLVSDSVSTPHVAGQVGDTAVVVTNAIRAATSKIKPGLGDADPARSWTAGSGQGLDADSVQASALVSDSVSVTSRVDADGDVASAATSGPQSWRCSPNARCTATR